MLESIVQPTMTVGSFLICTAASVVLGLLSALICRYKNRTSQSFLITIAVLPAIVQTVIILVNGNIGAGVAVAGAFSLVRFRSAQGTARDIALLFFTVALGLATGMGYVLLAVLFFVIVGAFLAALSLTGFCATEDRDRILRVQIPESLEYDGLFDDLLQQFTSKADLLSVKSTNLGTIYELQYEIRLKSAAVPKAFLDGLRCRNGNLNVICSRVAEDKML